MYEGVWCMIPLLQAVELSRKLGAVLVTGEMPLESEATPTHSDVKEELVSPRDRKPSVFQKIHDV